MRPQLTFLSVLAVATLLASHSGSAQRTASASGDWPMYRHDRAGTGFSPLAQITPANVSTLARAWTYGLQADPPAPSGPGNQGGVNSQATPIVVGGVMYVPAANRIVALDPATGREIWRHPVEGSAP